MNTLTTAVIGPSLSGKTSIISQYTDGVFPKQSCTSIEDRRQKKITLLNIEYFYEIIEVNGTEEYIELLNNIILESNSIIITIPYEVEYFFYINYYKSIIKNAIGYKDRPKVILCMTKVKSIDGIFCDHLDEKISEQCQKLCIDFWVKTSAQDNLGINTCFEYAVNNAKDHHTRKVISKMNYEISDRYGDSPSTESVLNKRIFGKKEPLNALTRSGTERKTSSNLSLNSLNSIDSYYEGPDDIIIVEDISRPSTTSPRRVDSIEEIADIFERSTEGSPRNQLYEEKKVKKFSGKMFPRRKNSSCLQM